MTDTRSVLARLEAANPVWAVEAVVDEDETKTAQELERIFAAGRSRLHRSAVIALVITVAAMVAAPALAVGGLFGDSVRETIRFWNVPDVAAPAAPVEAEIQIPGPLGIDSMGMRTPDGHYCGLTLDPTPAGGVAFLDYICFRSRDGFYFRVVDFTREGAQPKITRGYGPRGYRDTRVWLYRYGKPHEVGSNAPVPIIRCVATRAKGLTCQHMLGRRIILGRLRGFRITWGNPQP